MDWVERFFVGLAAVGLVALLMATILATQWCRLAELAAQAADFARGNYTD